MKTLLSQQTVILRNPNNNQLFDIVEVTDYLDNGFEERETKALFQKMPFDEASELVRLANNEKLEECLEDNND